MSTAGTARSSCSTTTEPRSCAGTSSTAGSPNGKARPWMPRATTSRSRRSRSRTRGSSSPEMDAGAADDGVVVDVVLEEGLLYLELANLFDRPLVDLQGRDVSGLRLFRHVEFLGPKRRVRTLLNSVPGYFGREGAPRVGVSVEYERPGSPSRTTTVTHDLELYRELAERI